MPETEAAHFQCYVEEYREGGTPRLRLREKHTGQAMVFEGVSDDIESPLTVFLESLRRNKHVMPDMFKQEGQMNHVLVGGSVAGETEDEIRLAGQPAASYSIR